MTIMLGPFSAICVKSDQNFCLHHAGGRGINVISERLKPCQLIFSKCLLSASRFITSEFFYEEVAMTEECRQTSFCQCPKTKQRRQTKPKKVDVTLVCFPSKVKIVHLTPLRCHPIRLSLWLIYEPHFLPQKFCHTWVNA